MFGAKDSRFDKNNTTIDGARNHTYGIDAQGKMYIYDLGNNKMVYYGDPGKGFAEVYVLQNEGNRFVFEGDQRKTQEKKSTPTNTNTAPVQSGYVAPPKVLDRAQLEALESQLDTYDTTRDTAKKKARLKRDASLEEKKGEFSREEGKYKGKKLSTLQDFGSTKTETDINTRNTLENLISSLSTMGLGGSRALTRQVLAAANMSNRKANATQATNNQNLDSAFNEYKGAYEGDLDKINDQFDYDVGEAERAWGQGRQNTLYKMADVYNAVDDTAGRQKYMEQGNSLNKLIAGSAFVNPRYTGKSRAMDTPELADYTQDIAQYNTEGIGAPGGLTPVGDGAAMPGNLAVRAIAVNDRDLGVKKKTEAELGYGV